jgi:hypothetical protein
MRALQRKCECQLCSSNAQHRFLLMHCAAVFACMPHVLCATPNGVAALCADSAAGVDSRPAVLLQLPSRASDSQCRAARVQPA